MNNAQRKQLYALQEQIMTTYAEVLAATESMREAYLDGKAAPDAIAMYFARMAGTCVDFDIVSALEEMRDEEQEKFDNMPEGLQSSSKGETLEATVEALDSSIESFTEHVESLDDALRELREALDEKAAAPGTLLEPEQAFETVLDTIEALGLAGNELGDAAHAG